MVSVWFNLWLLIKVKKYESLAITHLILPWYSPYHLLLSKKIVVKLGCPKKNNHPYFSSCFLTIKKNYKKNHTIIKRYASNHHHPWPWAVGIYQDISGGGLLQLRIEMMIGQIGGRRRFQRNLTWVVWVTCDYKLSGEQE